MLKQLRILLESLACVTDASNGCLFNTDYDVSYRESGDFEILSQRRNMYFGISFDDEFLCFYVFEVNQLAFRKFEKTDKR